MAISYPISLPASASPRIVTIKGACESSITESPFTAEQQVQSFPVDRWQAEIEYPIFDRAGGEQLLSRLLSLYGAAGVVLLGDDSGAVPRGVATGTPFVSGTAQSGRILLVGGCTPNITGWLKEGDWIQLGVGYRATRIQTSGGGTTDKYFYNTGVSVNLQKYVQRVRVAVLNGNAVTVRDGLGATQTIAAGTQAQVALKSTGDGVSAVQMIFTGPSAGAALDFVAWDPLVQRFGVDENRIPLANRDFSGWTAVSGAAITLTQNINQRLHKVVNADVDSDSGGFAAVDFWPRLRESPIDQSSLVLASAKGLFRFADDVATLTIDEALKYGGLKFTAMEAY